MCARACDPVTAELVAVEQDVAQVIVQTELEQLVSGGGVRPSIFVAVFYAQATLFRSNLEPLVVVGVAPTAILDAVDVVVVMHHFVKQSGAHALNRTGKGTCADVDFVAHAVLADPCVIPEGEMAVGLGRGLDGDGGS